MDHLKYIKPRRKTLSSAELTFIRRGKDGSVIPSEQLAEMNITNSIIERIVSDASHRIYFDEDA